VIRLENDVIDVEGVRAEDVGCFLVLLDQDLAVDFFEVVGILQKIFLLGVKH